jgi:hypothetical protein
MGQRPVVTTNSARSRVVNDRPLFNQENVHALLGHLAEGSLAHDLVSAAAAASTNEEAAAALRAILEGRIAQVREAVDHGD